MKTQRLLFGVCTVLIASTFLILTPNGASAETKVPKIITLCTHSLGTKYYAMAAGFAKILSTYLGTEVKVRPTSGPLEWMPAVARDEVDIGLANNWDSKKGFLAEGPYEKILVGKGSPIRLIASGSPNIMGVLTSMDSGITTGKDIKGKRFVGNIAGSLAQTAQCHAALANFGLTPKDVKMITVTSTANGIRAITEGRADATGTYVLGMGVATELDAVKGARVISYDRSPEAIKRFQQIYPEAVPITIEPEPGYSGVKESVTMMQYDSYMVARENIPDDLTYQITKTLWEHNRELWPIHPGLKTWKKDDHVTKNALIPYHPGAIRFYKEIGVWGEEMDKIQQDLLKLAK